MASIIVQRGSDFRAQLSNSNFARLHGVTGWNRLRLAFRWIMDNAATMNDGPMFAAGLCSGTGTNQLILDQSTQHFVGIRTVATQWNTGTTYWLLGSGGFATCKKVNTTFTSTGAFGVGYFVASPAASGARTTLFLDIIKGSPNYTFQIFGHSNGAGAFTDMPDADFNVLLNVLSPVYTNYSIYTDNTGIAVDEAINGTLDAINIGWNRVAPIVEISEVTVVPLA